MKGYQWFVITAIAGATLVALLDISGRDQPFQPEIAKAFEHLDTAKRAKTAADSMSAVNSSLANDPLTTHVAKRKSSGEDELFRPDPEKRYQIAESTEDLYVEPDFSYTGQRKISLSVSIRGIEHASSNGEIFQVYALPKTTDSVSCEPRFGDLMATRRTDASGNYWGAIDVPQHVKHLLIQTHIIGIDNSQCVNISPNQGQDYSVEFGAG